MKVVVQKYGGSSLATLDKIRAVADNIVQAREKGNDVVAVVSAMGDTTDNLIKMALELTKNPSRRELDMLLSSGERIAMSLLSMAICDLGFRAISFTGSQSGIITDTRHLNASILDVRPQRILSELSDGKIVIVAGFQGVSLEKEVTTLGRGGSDTTAVALAAALHAESCEIYSDVDGIYTSDPRVVSGAWRIERLSYGEAHEITSYGAKVLSKGAVEIAEQNCITIKALSLRNKDGGTLISASPSGSAGTPLTVTSEDDLLLVESRFPGFSEEDIIPFLDYMKELQIPYKTLNMHTSQEEGMTLFTIMIHMGKLPGIEHFKETLMNKWGDKFVLRESLSTAHLIGRGIGEREEVLMEALSAMKEKGIPPLRINVASFRITFFVPRELIKETVLCLHSRFFEGGYAPPGGDSTA